ncbi:FAD-dependent monooxygenase [Lacisediminimonas sp.]|uniref:FAD-dependent monooxygenase n=1 Tax=Lacisediminimonas sp. TaxID=3060582 RepID=UPI002726432B|nr:FAD-dependent monooxygenase [Lacisediminimonas sp.]MDO8300556.1 FAD-dependent monooxygenase [Lacisediminimonas sp.]MDO9215624.1 FAD-dependent monooxygenase [Lacisediminimonas sp.]
MVQNKQRALRVAIVGAGIGGLTAAAALHQRGIEVAVYERAAQMGEVGAGLQMGPNAVHVINALGIGEQFRKIAAEPGVRVSLNWNDGAVRVREQFKGPMQEKYGARYHTVHRSDVHQLLQSLVPENAIHTSAHCVAVENRESGAAMRFADGREIEADVVIGADGIHSAVQTAVFGTSPARFTNQICWRIILPMEELHRCADMLPVPLDGSEYTGWLGPTGHVLFYPLRNGELLNIFAGRVSQQWADENWAVPSPIADLLEAYAGWHPALLHILSKAKEANKWGIHDRDPLDRWVKGRIALLGDSAHPMMPTLAQGAAISMEDGYALARCLELGRSNPDAALATYEQERRPRATKVQLQARQQFENNQLVPAPPPLPVDWIYGYDVVNKPLKLAELA